MENEQQDKSVKPAGRTKGTGTVSTRLLRVNITPRQDRLLTRIRTEVGLSESEAVRRAIDDYLDKLIARGELTPDVPVTASDYSFPEIGSNDHE